MRVLSDEEEAILEETKRALGQALAEARKIPADEFILLCSELGLDFQVFVPIDAAQRQ